MPALKESFPVEFLLMDENYNLLHRQSSFTVENEKIISVHLPEGFLQIEQPYYWSLSIDFDDHDHSHKSLVSVWLQQVSMSDHELPASDDSSIGDNLELAQIYQERGLWGDAIALTASLHEQYPDNQAVQSAWTQLLHSLDLDIEFPAWYSR